MSLLNESKTLYAHLQLSERRSELRLMEIEPSSDPSRPIRCSLQKDSLGHEPQYSALSYVWGDERDRTTIIVNDVEFNVTRNCEEALKGLRGREVRSALWVDAICIDQNNISERNNQVAQMQQIFGQAAKVFCWLGPAKDGYDEALRSLDISTILETRAKTARDGPAAIDSFLENVLNERRCAALKHLSESPYWERVWVVQEIALAKEISILYGSVDLSWRFFQELDNLSDVKWFRPQARVAMDNAGEDALDAVSNASMSSMHARKVAGDLDKSQQDILSVLYYHRSSKATDPRDKIYGLLGLAYDSARFVTVDYTLSVESVYRDFAWRHIKETQSLAILLSATGETIAPMTSRLPSWMPDWSLEQDHQFSLGYKPHAAAHTTKCQLLSPDGEDILRVKGILCGRLELFRNSRDTSGLALEDLLFAKGPYDYPSGVPRLLAAFRALTSYITQLKREVGPLILPHMIGFLITLGMDADLDKYLHFDLEDVPGNEKDFCSGAEHALDGYDIFQHEFIRAFRDWTEGCIQVIDGILSRRMVPMRDKEGMTLSRAMFERLWGPPTDRPVPNECEELSFRRECLESWRESLVKTRSCSTIESMLELLLGRSSSNSRVVFTDPLPVGREPWCYKEYLRTSAVGGGVHIFTTDSGYLGRGPGSARPGDIVVVLYGCSAPVILRPKGDDLYSFLSVCFVEGLMNGEAVMNEPRKEDQVFQII